MNVRIKKLTDRMEKTRKQHEDARLILTKYSHESTYRLRETLLNAPPDSLQEGQQVPEFTQIKALVDEPIEAPAT